MPADGGGWGWVCWWQSERIMKSKHWLLDCSNPTLGTALGHFRTGRKFGKQIPILLCGFSSLWIHYYFVRRLHQRNFDGAWGVGGGGLPIARVVRHFPCGFLFLKIHRGIFRKILINFHQITKLSTHFHSFQKSYMKNWFHYRWTR